MSNENFDYKAALAVEEFLRLKRENKEMKAKIFQNSARMDRLQEDFPVIGHVKGQLKLGKKAKTPKTPDTVKSSPVVERTDEESTSVSSEKSPKKKDNPPGILATITRKEKESSDSKRRPAEAGRSKGVNQGGSQFHSTNRSAPPDVMEVSQPSKKD